MTSSPDNQRREQRYVYFHQVTVEKEHIIARGHSLDFSLKGMQITVDVPLDMVGGYLARFHLQEDQGLQRPKTILEQEGKVRWIRYVEGHSTLGIEFDHDFPLPIEALKQLNPTQHFSYLHIQEASYVAIAK